MRVPSPAVLIELPGLRSQSEDVQDGRTACDLPQEGPGALGVELKARNRSWFPFPMSRALRQVVCSSRAVYTSVHLNHRV